jgi:phosphoribosylformylglycinamidine cyclo-ligase
MKKTQKKKASAYARAGVDIDEMMSGLTAVKRMVKTTSVKGLLNDIGSFGGLFSSPGSDKALVASTDGVGTKLKVASMAGRHDTVGQDIVNHCVNDILVQGASPLFFLDYIGTAKLKGGAFTDIVKGICKACRENGCALLGGETAEMPGLYPAGEYDLVGTIIGSVEKKKIITGKSVKPGDVLIGLPSSGLHTNGYSLARQVIFDKAKLKTTDILPGTKRKVADILLAVHRSYLHPIATLMKKVNIHAMAHITGGGLIDNLPRSLPPNTRAIIDLNSWTTPEVFRFIEKKGKVDHKEMYRVFNMGIGFIIIVRKKDAETAMKVLKRAKAKPVIVGHIEKGKRCVKLTS